MKKEKIDLNFKNKKIALEVYSCNFFDKFRGLMFRKKGFSKILLFEFNKKVNFSIHSFFVFFPFLAIWLDDKNKIMEIQKVGAFKFCVKPKKPFKRLLEIPFTRGNKNIFLLLDDESKTFK